MNTSRGKVTISSYHVDNKSSAETIKYLVKHDNAVTTLEQELTLTNASCPALHLWQASIEMKGFPEEDNPQGAALKLAEWMERLAGAIRCGEYDLSHLSSGFIDIEDSTKK